MFSLCLYFAQGRRRRDDFGHYGAETRDTYMYTHVRTAVTVKVSYKKRS